MSSAYRSGNRGGTKPYTSSKRGYSLGRILGLTIATTTVFMIAYAEDRAEQKRIQRRRMYNSYWEDPYSSRYFRTDTPEDPERKRAQEAAARGATVLLQSDGTYRIVEKVEATHEKVRVQEEDIVDAEVVEE